LQLVILEMFPFYLNRPGTSGQYFSTRWRFMSRFSELWRRVLMWKDTNVSKDFVASIFITTRHHDAEDCNVASLLGSLVRLILVNGFCSLLS